jgi:hypothetical protein
MFGRLAIKCLLKLNPLRQRMHLLQHPVCRARAGGPSWGSTAAMPHGLDMSKLCFLAAVMDRILELCTSGFSISNQRFPHVPKKIGTFA